MTKEQVLINLQKVLDAKGVKVENVEMISPEVYVAQINKNNKTVKLKVHLVTHENQIKFSEANGLKTIELPDDPNFFGLQVAIVWETPTGKINSMLYNLDGDYHEGLFLEKIEKEFAN